LFVRVILRSSFRQERQQAIAPDGTEPIAQKNLLISCL
jgi:hypothetical protein